MPILRQTTWYTVAECRAHPDWLYIFGDNLARVGKGGQAIIRDEPNAIGIPTKNDPDTETNSYFTDDTLQNRTFRETLNVVFDRLADHLADGGTVIFPADGVGTGRAELRERAPQVLALINARIAILEQLYKGTLK